MGPSPSTVAEPTAGDHEISIVVPVYRGSAALEALVGDIEPHTKPSTTSEGHGYRVVELLLVHDCGPGDSDRVIRGLEERYDCVRAIWLSRNYGQHAATLAGMASARAEWIVTMDEDG
jgi:glycosyltransferase involved in cell wall biosynthesis